MKEVRLSARRVPKLPGLCCVLALLGGSIAGCGSDGPAMGRVSGKVTYQGNPVANATVTFVPGDAASRPGIGITNESGEYTATTFEKNDGVLVGNCKVSIVARAAFDGKLPAGVGEAFLEEMQTKGKALIPEKYFNPESSQLTATIAEGSNDLNFDLQ